ncbi:MAG: O-antigen ligase domain-containing protein [Flavobacterium sp.]|nr:MAG: O-antigen ligase domain-containing protein [Flavobacterium sp.]
MANTYNFLKTVSGWVNQQNRLHPLLLPIVLVLACIPMAYSVNSVALGIFVFSTLFFFKKQDAHFEFNLLLPVLLYALMALSVFWSIDLSETVPSLSKELPLLIIPVCFILFRALTDDIRQNIIRYYGIAMFAFCIFYLVKAAVRFAVSGDPVVFFYHQLVTEDVNAIHVSVYFSVAFFHFFTRLAKSIFDKIAAGLLFVTVFLLSSKNVIGIFILLIAIYFLFYSGITKKTRIVSLLAFVVFIVGLAFVPQINQRFKIESSTVLHDNTVNHQIGDGNIHNISVSQAWNNKAFTPNDYFPGTAFRVYQFRIFLELMQEDCAWLTGYGLNASYSKIEKKTLSYNLFSGDAIRAGYQKKNFHDQYIQNFAELGIFGFLLLVAMLWINIKNAVKSKDFVHISFAVLMISLFLTESFLWRQRGVTFFTMMYCLFNAYGHKKAENL